jgi:hypothetical protein
MNPDVVKITEIFLVPNSILVGALGVAPTEGLKTGVSLIGLISSGLWALCSLTAWANTDPLRVWVLALLPLIFIVLWAAGAKIHGRNYREERRAKRAEPGAALPGCNRTTPPPPACPAMVATFGYTFVFDPGEERPFAVEGHRKSTKAADGTETDLDEEITITYAGRTGKIVNGKLTVGGKDRGAVKPGDQITFTPPGGVAVSWADR